MSEAMELSERQFDQIGSYVREHLGSWIREIAPPATTVQIDPIYLERIVRVEEELKSQRELMKQGFEQMDKRFEEMRADMNTRFQETRAEANSRFEAMDKRFQETRAEANSRFDAMDKRFAETRADMKAGFEVARSHTNHRMTFLTIVLLVLGSAMTLATVLLG